MSYQNRFRDYRGWTEWIWPARHYKLACCDCGLVHDVRLQVFKVSNSARGVFLVDKALSRKRYRVGMKVKRNVRSTAQMRRHMK